MSEQFSCLFEVTINGRSKYFLNWDHIKHRKAVYELVGKEIEYHLSSDDSDFIYQVTRTPIGTTKIIKRINNKDIESLNKLKELDLIK